MGVLPYRARGAPSCLIRQVRASGQGLDWASGRRAANEWVTAWVQE